MKHDATAMARHRMKLWFCRGLRQDDKLSKQEKIRFLRNEIHATYDRLHLYSTAGELIREISAMIEELKNE